MTQITFNLFRMTDAEGREEAAQAGIAVGAIKKAGKEKTVTVGSFVVFHDGMGGASCWGIRDAEGVEVMYSDASPMMAGKAWRGAVGSAIAGAVRLQK